LLKDRAFDFDIVFGECRDTQQYYYEDVIITLRDMVPINRKIPALMTLDLAENCIVKAVAVMEGNLQIIADDELMEHIR
jgi:hypothetical protein